MQREGVQQGKQDGMGRHRLGQQEILQAGASPMQHGLQPGRAARGGPHRACHGAGSKGSSRACSKQGGSREGAVRRGRGGEGRGNSSRTENR